MFSMSKRNINQLQLKPNLFRLSYKTQHGSQPLFILTYKCIPNDKGSDVSSGAPEVWFKTSSQNHSMCIPWPCHIAKDSGIVVGAYVKDGKVVKHDDR